MKKILVCLCTFASLFSQAQTPASTKLWTTGGRVSLALAQGGTRNWAPGGDRFSLAINAFTTFFANRTRNKSHWDNSLEANYGLVNTRVAGVIKNDDKFEIISRYGYDLGKAQVKKFRLAGLFNLRSQFADGYDYDGATRKRISAFLAPASVILSPGVEYYSKNKTTSIHFSPATPRWILVPNRPYELAANYNVEANEKVKIEAGAFAELGFQKEVLKNITYKGRLQLFSNYLSKPQNIDVYYTNMVYMKINEHLGAVYNFDLQYDDDTRIFGYFKNKPSTQMKSIFGAGLSCKF